MHTWQLHDLRLLQHQQCPADSLGGRLARCHAETICWSPKLIQAGFWMCRCVALEGQAADTQTIADRATLVLQNTLGHSRTLSAWPPALGATQQMSSPSGSSLRRGPAQPASSQPARAAQGTADAGEGAELQGEAWEGQGTDHCMQLFAALMASVDMSTGQPGAIQLLAQLTPCSLRIVLQVLSGLGLHLTACTLSAAALTQRLQLLAAPDDLSKEHSRGSDRK